MTIKLKGKVSGPALYEQQKVPWHVCDELPLITEGRRRKEMSEN
jgi:hypothetical protein